MCGHSKLGAAVTMPGVPCQRCGRPVFDAEKQTAFGKTWHLFCFSCNNCRKLLDVSEAAPCDDELYCDHCAGELFSTCQDAVLDCPDTSEEPTEPDASPCPTRELLTPSPSQSGSYSLRPTPSPTAITTWYNRQHPSKYSDVGRCCSSDGSSTACSYEDGDQLDAFFRGGCGEDVSFGRSRRSCFGGGVACRRCGRNVYHAEMVLASGAAFHTACFSCNACRKPLDTINVFESHGEIYCKHCLSKLFGPSGYGFGAGAGVLQTM